MMIMVFVDDDDDDDDDNNHDENIVGSMVRYKSCEMYNIFIGHFFYMYKFIKYKLVTIA